MASFYVTSFDSESDNLEQPIPQFQTEAKPTNSQNKGERTAAKLD